MDDMLRFFLLALFLVNLPLVFAQESETNLQLDLKSDQMMNPPQTREQNEPILSLSDIILVIVGGPLAVILGIFLGRYLEGKKILASSLSAIRIELEENQKGFDEDFPRNIVHEGKNVNYIHTLFDAGSYDSLVSSGYLIRLDTKMQSNIVNLYSRIKLNNQYVLYIDSLQDNFELTVNETNKDKAILERIQLRYQLKLVGLQNEIKKYMKMVLEELPKTKKS